MNHRNVDVYNIISAVYIVIATLIMILKLHINSFYMIKSVTLCFMTAILGMIVSLINVNILKYISLVLAVLNLILCIFVPFLTNIGAAVVFQMCTFIPSILELVGIKKQIKHKN